VPSNTELDALLSRVREMQSDPAYPDRNAVAYDCYRMFEDLATRYKEEFAMRDRYKRQSSSWRDKALELADATQWRPIESAPRDGAMILIAHNHWGTVNVTLAGWGRVNYGCGQFEDGWRSYSGFLTGAKWWCPIPSVEGLAGKKADNGAVCSHAIGQTTCGYTERNHCRADGSPMDHPFTPESCI